MSDQSNEEIWHGIYNCPDEEIWATRMALKQKLFDYIKEQFRETWLKNQGDPSRVVSLLEKMNPNALVIGFCRRFATYKRAHLLFTNLERLSKIVNDPEHPVIFLFAGKAHPADGAGQGLIKKIYEISQRPEFLGKIIFLEDYDFLLARRLVSGVDIWMNTPTRPLEASGTSGEKAEMNGLLNFSVRDGWWYEGYREGAGWALTDKRTYTDQAQQDKLDSATIYSMLENEIIPLYFAKNSKGYSPEWIQYIKKSLAQIAPNYTMSRMIHDYMRKFYIPQTKRTQELRADNYALTRDIVAWKENVDARWDKVHVEGGIHVSDNLLNAVNNGKDIEATIRLNTAGLGRSLGIELVIYQDMDGESKFYGAFPFKVVAEDGDVLTYNLKQDIKYSGMFRYAFRIFPWNDKLPHRQDFAYLKWI